MGGYNNDVCFVHIPKTGGWSAKLYLREHLPGFMIPVDQSGNRLDEGESGLPIGHVALRDIPRFTGREIESFDKVIATIRLPYSQQVSQWVYWKMRHMAGGQHIHDLTAAKYDYLHEWLEDPRCDFHVWYQQHHAGSDWRPHPPPRNDYKHFGGIYRYWLEVDGEIPDNVEVIRCEQMGDLLPKAIAPYCDDPGDVPRENTSGWSKTFPWWRFYQNPQAVMRVEEKAAWAFEHWYPKISDGWDPIQNDLADWLASRQTTTSDRMFSVVDG